MWLFIAAIVLAMVFVYSWLSGAESAGEAAYEWALLVGVFALAWFLSRRVKAWVERRRSHST
jgi:hypothetical protein